MEQFSTEINRPHVFLLLTCIMCFNQHCMLDNPSVTCEWVLGYNPALGAQFSGLVPLIKSAWEALCHHISLPLRPGTLLHTHSLALQISTGLTGAKPITLSWLSVLICVAQHEGCVALYQPVEREWHKWVPQVTVCNGGVRDVGMHDGEASGLLQGSESGWYEFNAFNNDNGGRVLCLSGTCLMGAALAGAD